MKTILIIFFIFCILPAWGQTVEIDSLKNILMQLELVQGYEKNKLYFSTLHELCGAIYVHKPDTSLFLSERLRQLAQKAPDRFWEAKGKLRVAYYYLHGRDLTKAVTYIDEAIAIFRHLQSKEGLALALRIKAEAYLTQSLNDKALIYLFEALLFSNQIVPKEQALARREGVLHRLGDVYQTLGEYKKAKDYYVQGLDFVAQHAPNSFIQYFILAGLNNILIQEKQYEKAIKNYRYILTKSPKHLKMIFYASYKGLGDIYKATNQRDSAKFYFNNALETVRTVNNPVSLTPILHVLAVLYMDEKDYDSALRTEEEMLGICEKFNVRDSKNIAYGLLADIHKSKGNYQQAFLYHQKFKNLSDSLAREQNNREIGKMEANYEFSKKEMVFLREQEIKKLETAQLKKDILLQEVATEKQTLLASQTTERNQYLLAENKAKEQEKIQQARLFEAEKKRKEVENQQKLAQQRWYAYLVVPYELCLPNNILFLA
jgi:tetratricopeptide (TPR) repeat protein